ncbi:MAG: hypothetical protein CO114_03455, partial [Euryarchaeota archaeon CG_4_9_14_3_um_filter_38_12]
EGLILMDVKYDFDSEGLILMDVKYDFDFEIDKKAMEKIRQILSKRLQILKAEENILECLLKL